MDLQASLNGVGMLIGGIILLSIAELLIPLRKRTMWSARHLVPNITMTFITFATNMAMNIPLLIGFVYLEQMGWGLFNLFELPLWADLLGAVLVLDLAWYVTHRAMHISPLLWRIHVAHHSDPMLDVTTTIRQHPLESLWRYLLLAAFGFAFGVSPAAFAVYRLWSAFYGQFEHANIKLPQWLDTAMTLVFSSPNMHKIHHSRHQHFTDTNYGNIFSIWDRMLGTFTPSKNGLDIAYGLEGYDNPREQTVMSLLAQPFAKSKESDSPAEATAYRLTSFSAARISSGAGASASKRLAAFATARAALD